jgi:monofunctional biosynthetic peptidoglycan transglycosylase
MLKKKFFISACIVIALGSTLLYFFTCSLPDVHSLKDPQYTMTLMLKDADGKKVPFPVGQQNPHWTPLSNIPPTLQWSVIVAEDDTFYRHNGFNFSAMREAFWENIKKRKPVRGGSTITQQLAKNLYLSKKKSLVRKLKEAVITWRLERILSKNRILELYVNIIEWGPGVYGVEEASRHYFRKTPADLNFYESVLLAAIIPSPRLYDPRNYPERTLERYKTVLGLMHLSKLITLDQYEAACAVQLCVDHLDHALIICPLVEKKEEEENDEGSRETPNSQELLI